MGIRTIIDPFTQQLANSDPQVIKYAARIIQKLNTDNGQGGGGGGTTGAGTQ